MGLLLKSKTKDLRRGPDRKTDSCNDNDYPPGLRAGKVQFCSNQASTVLHSSSTLPVETMLLYDPNNCFNIILNCRYVSRNQYTHMEQS